MLEGDSFLYRAALGILAVLESRLFFPERKELLELLRCVIRTLLIFLVLGLTNFLHQGREQSSSGSGETGRDELGWR